MSYTLIIAEKPSAAKKIAESLADSKPTKKGAGCPYYELTHGNEDIMVCSGVGHVYTLEEKKKGKWVYPTYDIDWFPSHKVRKDADYTKKYVDTITKLAKDAKKFIIATDYDTEGEVIGYNILRFACKQKDALRMKFSTVTKPDLQKAFKTPEKTINWGQANAGITRHNLDWLYGINISRALTLAIKKGGQYKVLSSGRVQGPALKILVDKELEIKAFIPKQYWELHLDLKDGKTEIESSHKEDKFWDEKEAQKIFKKCDKKDATVKQATAKKFQQPPPTPFDLGSLQTEAHRCFGMAPKETLEHAQSLYSHGWTSYPRTSSQKLPKEIGYKTILDGLKKNPLYQKLAEFVIKETKMIPKEGKKTDPAHPAVYPTGLVPGNLRDREKKVYDLIVKRFIAVFGEAATRETVTYTFDCEQEDFITKGTRTVDPKWHLLYAPYVKLDEVELPKLEEGKHLKHKKLEKIQKETKPPKRYTASSIINELEKRGLGTKATRAEIVDNLFKRGYVHEKSIQATELGIEIIEILQGHVPEMVDVELTKSFEAGMDKIRENKKTQEEVIEKAKKELDKILKKFKKDELEIGKELVTSQRAYEAKENTLGLCPVCKKGKFRIKRGPYGKFVGCTAYPDCKGTAKIPQKQI